MSGSPLFDELMETTRGRVLALLRRRGRTVRDLADALDVTANAVRRHLAYLERDGLVETAGEIRDGVGKPARVYRLTGRGRAAFPRAYGGLLERVLDVLRDRGGAVGVGDVMDDVGRRLAREQRRDGFPVDGDRETKTRAACAALGGLGGDAEVVRTNGDLMIKGYDCPLGRIVCAHPEACRAAEAFLEELLDVEVGEECERGTPARCRFRVPLTGESA